MRLPPGMALTRPARPRAGKARRSFVARALLILGAVAAALPAAARVNVDTVPDRDSVQLTIYNSVDLTLVRETRLLTFRKGLNRLEFSWANTLIDPTSVEFKALTHAGDVEVLDASFPPRVTNTLEWRINSEFSGEVQVEIQYFTSGISWAADYVASAGRDEKTMSLAGNVRITNQSGEDYANAQVRLVVGVIKLVDDIAALAQGGGSAGQRPPRHEAIEAKRDLRMRLGKDMKKEVDVAEKTKAIVKEGLSEYFLYTVEGRDTIPSGWSKRLPSFSAREVPLASYYKYEHALWGARVMRFYRFKNDQASHLGAEPLPNGAVKAFRAVSDDQLQSFAGRGEVKYIPIDETVELELGPDAEVLVKPVLLDWRKEDLRFSAAGQVKGWTVTESWRIDVENAKEIDVTVDIRRGFRGDWTLQTGAAHEKVDATKVKFLLALKPHEKKTLTYEVTVRHGINATR